MSACRWPTSERFAQALLSPPAPSPALERALARRRKLLRPTLKAQVKTLVPCVALSDSRILDFEDGEVSLSYKDYRDGDRRKVMTLSAEELLHRFLLHVLPKSFMRFRHFGFLANRCRAQRLAQIRTDLAAPAPEVAETPAETGPFDGYPCPTCRAGRLHVTTRLAPKRRDGG